MTIEERYEHRVGELLAMGATAATMANSPMYILETAAGNQHLTDTFIMYVSEAVWVTFMKDPEKFFSYKPQ